MLLEVCVDNLESAKNAVMNGADELEVCSRLHYGGLTPSFELVKDIIEMIDEYEESNPSKRPKVNVMIRCNTSRDFYYDDHEVGEMIEDIKRFKTLKVDRFVFGALTSKKRGNQLVYVVTCKKIKDAAHPKPLTFHRAFDVCPDPFDIIEDIVKLGFTRLLTSGQQDSAADEKALKLIKNLIEKHGDKIEIMPGAGINEENARIFVDLGCKIIHGSFRQKTDDKEQYITDGDVVRKIKEIISSEDKG